MRVLMVSINKLRSYRPALPIGMITVASQLPPHGHAVRCLDLMFEDDDEAAVRREVAAFAPEVLGIAVRNVDSLNLLEPEVYTPLALSVADWARDQRPGLRVVLGGAGFTTIPEELMAFTGADHGILGFGEKAFPALLARLRDGGDADLVAGEIRPDPRGGFQCRPPCRDSALDGVHPLDPGLYDPRYRAYAFDGHDGDQRIAGTVQTKKGCLLDCVFCGNFLIDGPGVKRRPPAVVADEIASQLADGTDRYEFVDGVFNLPLDHALAVLDEVERRDIRAPFSAMVNPGAVNADLVERMARAGCRQVEFGTDSGADHVLAGLGKNFRSRQIRAAHRLFDAAGIAIQHCLFIGSPGDDRDSVLRTFDLMDDLVPDGHPRHRAFWTFGLRISRGTPLHRIALAEGLLGAADALLAPRFYVAPAVLADDGLLDVIQDRVVGNGNHYLWWGLPQIPLRQRLAEVRARTDGIAAAFARHLAAPAVRPPAPHLEGQAPCWKP
jgi:radical SAM superfamily enzyme YgiQ (UPF0313 family)